MIKVYIVGWNGRNFNEIYAIFSKKEDAEKYLISLHSHMAPNGSSYDRNSGWILEKELQ